MWMTFNHQKTNSTKFALTTDLKFEKLLSFFLLSGLDTTSPLRPILEKLRKYQNCVNIVVFNLHPDKQKHRNILETQYTRSKFRSQWNTLILFILAQISAHFLKVSIKSHTLCRGASQSKTWRHPLPRKHSSLS